MANASPCWLHRMNGELVLCVSIIESWAFRARYFKKLLTLRSNLKHYTMLLAQKVCFHEYGGGGYGSRSTEDVA